MFQTVSFRRIYVPDNVRPIVCEVVKCCKPISFLGDLIPENGTLRCGSEYLTVRARALAYPKSVGSTVGPYVLYRARKLGTNPAVLMCVEPDILSVTACAICDIPLIQISPEVLGQLTTGSVVMVDFDKCLLHILELDACHDSRVVQRQVQE